MSEAAHIEWLERAHAEQLGYEVVDLLGDAVDRPMIVGSVRRRKINPKDVEILFVPRFGEAPTDMFGDPVGEGVNLQLARVRELLREGVFEHRPDKNGVNCCGAGVQRLRFKGVALDLFGCLPPSQYGVLAAIRTGPADFSHAFVTPKTMGGKWLKFGQQVKDGGLYDRGQLIRTPTEESFFEAIGMPWLDPWERR